MKATRTEKTVDQLMTYFNPRVNLGVNRDMYRQSVEKIIQEALDKTYAEGYDEGIDSERFWGHLSGDYMG